MSTPAVSNPDQRRGEQEKILFERALETAFRLACFNQGYAERLCQDAAVLAQHNPALKATLRKLLRVRTQKWPEWRQQVLVTHYALFMFDEDRDHDRALRKLAAYEKRHSKMNLSPETLDNRISKILSSFTGEALPDWLPDWAHPIIQERQAKGKKTRAK